MSLPASNHGGASSTVHLSGGPVTVRGLTIGEVRACKKLDPDPADHLAIMFATGVTLEEAKAWWDQALAGDLALLITEIFRVSGMDDGATFPQPPGDDAAATAAAG